jgi:hypothetical protein
MMSVGPEHGRSGDPYTQVLRHRQPSIIHNTDDLYRIAEDASTPSASPPLPLQRLPGRFRLEDRDRTQRPQAKEGLQFLPASWVQGSSLRRDLLAHLATGTFVAKAENVIQAAACDPRRIMICPPTRDAAEVHPNGRCRRPGCAQLFAQAVPGDEAGAKAGV